MSRFAKRDIPATEAAQFDDERSFVALDGSLRLYGHDWEIQALTVFTRDNFHCRKCGKDIHIADEPIDAHHLVPRGEGGPDDLSNLVTLCRWCHTNAHADRNPRWTGGQHGNAA